MGPDDKCHCCRCNSHYISISEQSTEAEQGIGVDKEVNLEERACRREAATVHKWTCNGQILYQCRHPCHHFCHNFNGSGGTQTNNDIDTNKSTRWWIATQEEFDDIAQEFTLRERMLMEGDHSGLFSRPANCNSHTMSGNDIRRPAKKNRSKLSIMQKLNSQYGTPFVGNYALEVIEMALSRRGVELEFFRLP